MIKEKKLILDLGTLIKAIRKDYNIYDEEEGRICPFYIFFKRSKEECENCFENELEYIKTYNETPYNFIDLPLDELFLYLGEDSHLTGQYSQQYFKKQLWTKWHKLLVLNKVVYIPEQFLTDYYMEVVKS